MRVLMLSWEYPPHSVGGLGSHVTELVPALTTQGVEVHLLTPRWAGGAGEEAVAQVDGSPPRPSSTVYRVEPPGVDRADFFTSVWRTNLTTEEQARQLIARRGGFDLIHAHDWLLAFAAFALKHSYKFPLIGTIHATEYGRSRGNLSGEVQRAIHNAEWWLTYEAWRVICCSSYMANEVARLFQTPADKMAVIPNGVDVARFDRLEGVDLSSIRADYAMPDERIVFYVGRIVEEKGVGVLIEAVPQVLASFPKAKFVIAGTGSYGEELRRRAAELGLADKVYFAGFVSDEVRDRLLKVADVAVFPSLYEPFGIVALEAMAAKAPVVASRVGGLEEVVEHNETGILVHPGNVGSLAWGILHTLHRPDWAKSRAEKAYQVVSSEYNWRRIAERTCQLYERVCSERQASYW